MSTSPITVRVNPSLKLSQCTDQESSRYALAGVMVEPVLGTETIPQGIDANGKPCNFTDQPVSEVYVIATDSRCLAVTRQPGLAVDTAIMPGRFATPAKKTSVSKSVSLNGQWVSEETHRTKHTTESASQPIIEGRFPRYHDVLPDPRSGKTVSVRFDAAILAKLSEALTDTENKGIDLIFQCVESGGSTHISDSPIMVAGANGIGAMMPCSRMDHSIHVPHSVRAERDHHESVNRYESYLSELRANAKRANTTERKSQVLAMLNPVAENPA